MQMSKYVAALCATVAMAGVSTGANAATTVTQTIKLSQNTPSQQAINYFDTNLGTLTGVTFQYAYTNGGSFTATNSSGQVVSGPAGASSFISLTGNFSDFPSLTGDSRNFQNFGNVTFAPNETATFAVVAIRSGVVTDTAAVDLAALSRVGGGQSNLFPFVSFFTVTPSGVDPALTRLATSSTGFLSISYDYTAVTAAVPEPATWAMMLVGFGMVAGAARYRRRSTVTTFA
jgi:hypothetical protein